MEKSDKVYPWERIFEIVVLIALLVLFNFFPQWVGGANNINGNWSFVPVLASTFNHYLWMLDLYWVLSLGMSFYLLGQGRWSVRSRWMNLAIRIFGLVIVVLMLVGPPVLGLNPEYVAFHNTPLSLQQSFSENVLPWLLTAFYIALAVNLISNLITMTIKLIKEIRKMADK